MRSMNISLWHTARSSASLVAAGRPIPGPLNRHDHLAARVALSAAETRFQIEHGIIRRQPQPVEQRAWRDQHVVAARGALEADELNAARPSKGSDAAAVC